MRGIESALMLVLATANVIAAVPASAGDVLDVGGAIIDIAADPIRNDLFATLDTDEVVRISFDSHLVTAREPLSESAGPVAVSPDGLKLFVALQDSYDIAVFQLPSMAYQGTFDTSSTWPIDDLSAGTDWLYASATGYLAIIDPATGAELYVGSPGPFSVLLRLSSDQSILYAITRDENPTDLFVYDVSTGVPVLVNQDCGCCIGAHAHSMVLSPDEKTVYVAANGVWAHNRQPTGLLNREFTFLGSGDRGISLAVNGTVLVAGSSWGELTISSTADFLPYHVQTLEGQVKSDGIVTSTHGNEVAIAIGAPYPSSPGPYNRIEFVDSTAWTANRGGVKLRPIDDIDGLPIYGAYEEGMFGLGSAGFIDLKNGIYARSPVEPGSYTVRLDAWGHLPVTIPVTIGAGAWTDLGDVVMARTANFHGPGGICAEPAIIGTQPTSITIHGLSFHPGAVVTPYGPHTIHDFSWQDWATIEATVSANEFSPVAERRLALTVTNPGGDQATGTLLYLPGEVSALNFSIAEVSVDEDVGSVDLQVYRSGSSSGLITVDYETVAGTATGGSDYTPVSDIFTWPDGDSDPKTITVPILQDAIPEGPEAFTVELSNPTGGAVLGAIDTTEVTIDDDDSSTVRFTAASATISEDGGTVTLAVRRTGDITAAGSVSWATANGTAVAGEDYTTAGGTLDWPAGNGDDQTIEVTILNDALFEDSEVFTVTLSSPGGNAFLGEPSTATVNISDDDEIEIVFASPTFTGGEGDGVATITALRTGATNRSVTVDYETADGTATAASDYTPVSDTLSWADGDTTPKTFDVPLTDDGAVEANETVLLSLTDPTGGAILGALATAELTIEDNDGSQLRFASATYPTAENAGTIAVTVERYGGDSSGAVGVDYATVDDSATAGFDYLATSDTLSWADGDTDSKSFTVTLLDDSLLEGQETIGLQLSNPTGNASLGSPAVAEIEITDDDQVEVRVNTTTDQPQTRPAVAINSDDASVVVWESYLQDGDGWGIFGQRFDSDGAPAGSEFQINSTTAGDQRDSSVAMAADGSFFVVWRGNDGMGDGIRGRLFDAGGAPLGPEFTINMTTTGDQDEPEVAIDGAGAALVVWHSDATGDLEIRGRAYTAAGAPVGSEFAVNTTTADDQQSPAVAGSSGGGFVVAWQSWGQDGPAEGIIARRFSSTGGALGGEVIANQWTAGDQIAPSVGVTATGEYLVAWEDTVHQDGMGSSIRARWFSSTGVPQTDDMQLNEHWLDDQMAPRVTCDSTGITTVVWVSEDQDGSDLGVYGRTLDDVGSPLTQEVRFNIHTAGVQHRPAAARSDSGASWVVWASGGQDGSGDGIFGIFGPEPVQVVIFVDGFESGTTGAWSAVSP